MENLYRVTQYMGSSDKTSVVCATADEAARVAVEWGTPTYGAVVYDLVTRGDSQIARIGDRDEYVTTRTTQAREFAAALANLRPLPRNLYRR